MIFVGGCRGDPKVYIATPPYDWYDYKGNSYEGETIDDVYEVFACKENIYFVDMCRDLLNQIRRDGYDVIDDSYTLTKGVYIEPPNIEAGIYDYEFTEYDEECWDECEDEDEEDEDCNFTPILRG